MRKVILFLFLLFPLVAFAFSASDIEKYYQNKDLYEAKSMIQSFSDQGILEKNPRLVPLVSGFIGGLMVDHPTLNNQLKEMPFSHYMNALIDRVNQNMKVNAYQLKPYLNLHNITTPQHIETLWGLFYATGDSQILGAMQNYIIWKSQSLADTEIDMPSLVALSSLQENAPHHPLVQLALNKVLQSASVQKKLSLLQNFAEIAQ